ncbi:MAG: hypothetical protein ACOCVL_03745, partial [Candidatus Sumerlaeota bacterium]
SSPLMLEDEIRFYFTRSYERHGEDHLAREDRPERQVCVARSKPDRFVAAQCDATGHILTRPFWQPAPTIFVNARCRTGGYIKAEILDVEGRVIPGFEMEKCHPIEGDTLAGELCWIDSPGFEALSGKEIRIRMEVKEASLFSIAAGDKSEISNYRNFKESFFLPKDQETYQKPRH